MKFQENPILSKKKLRQIWKYQQTSRKIKNILKVQKKKLRMSKNCKKFGIGMTQKLENIKNSMKTNLKCQKIYAKQMVRKKQKKSNEDTKFQKN